MNFEPYLDHLQMKRACSPQTIRAYRSDLLLFSVFLQQQSVSGISSVSHALINDYIRHMREKMNPRFGRKGLTDASIARRLAAVSGYFEYIRATEDSKLRNPLHDLANKWKKNNDPKPIDELVLDLLLTGITNIRDRALFHLFLASGVRISEMHQLNRNSISIELERSAGGTEHITGSGEVIGKGSKRRKFYVDETSLLIYAEYLGSRTDQNPALFLSERKQRMSVRAIQDTWTKLCRRLGSQNINVHRLRHTYATRLANANISSMVLKELMGHASFTTTQRYFKLNDTTLARGYFSAMEYLKS
jgi:site-specific recombinase XerD